MYSTHTAFRLHLRYTFGLVSPLNVLTNAGGTPATITASKIKSSFTLASFFATPVYVPTLNLKLKGVKGDGTEVSETLDILSPDRTLVRLYSLFY